LKETLEPVLPLSEQFKLQQRRAIATSGEPPGAFAFLQQSGKFDIGLSPACTPAPVAPLKIATTRIADVSHCLILEADYIDWSLLVSSSIFP
jgi:hypothetical protein